VGKCMRSEINNVSPFSIDHDLRDNPFSSRVIAQLTNGMIKQISHKITLD